MSGSTVDALTVAAPLTGPELVHVVQGGNSRQTAVASLRGVRNAYVVGNWIDPWATGWVATQGQNANLIRFAPFTVLRRMTVSQLGIRVTAGSPGGSVRLGVYGHNATTGRPTGAPLASTPNVSIASAVSISSTINETPPTLEPNTIYWAASLFSASCTIVAFRLELPLVSCLVGATTLDRIVPSGTAKSFLVSANQTFGELPDVTSASFAETPSNATMPAVFIRVGSLP
jgi:hypothetical protein